MSVNLPLPNYSLLALPLSLPYSLLPPPLHLDHSPTHRYGGDGEEAGAGGGGGGEEGKVV